MAPELLSGATTRLISSRPKWWRNIGDTGLDRSECVDPNTSPEMKLRHPGQTRDARPKPHCATPPKATRGHRAK